MITDAASAKVEIVERGSFEPQNHYYPKVLNANLHPLASFFLNLSKERIISRYCHLNPLTDSKVLGQLIDYQPRFMCWGGVDLLHCTTTQGNREMVVIETNSSPSGHKSMPLSNDHDEQGSYRTLVENVFGPRILKLKQSRGVVAVLYDKNYMETSAYAHCLAEFLNEKVYLVPCFNSNWKNFTRFHDNLLEIRIAPDSDKWIPVRAAHRYVTQKPWNRIPVNCRTLLFNPIVTCLAGGRNKLLAAKAYDIFNAEIAESGLQIRMPETLRDVSKAEIPLIIRSFGGHAVIKDPYSNAGQGVFTVTSDAELEAFMKRDFVYDRFIVQSLIGNYQWSSQGSRGRFFQVGTVPSKKNKLYVADLRMMIGSTANGFRPMAFYARKAHAPLADTLPEGTNSAEILVTNLSIKLGEDKWETDTSRLLIFDRKDFNILGMGLDALISGYVQSVLAINAIDRLACSLINSKGKFRFKLFRSLNNDPALHQEILVNGPVSEHSKCESSTTCSF